MRCIKCLNSFKKSRMTFGLCSVLLSVCLCLSSLLSPSVSAYDIGDPIGSFGVRTVTFASGQPINETHVSVWYFYGNTPYIYTKPTFYFNSAFSFEKGQILSFDLDILQYNLDDYDSRVAACPRTVDTSAQFRVIGCTYDFSTDVSNHTSGSIISGTGTIGASTHKDYYTHMHIDLLVAYNGSASSITLDGDLFSAGSNVTYMASLQVSRINWFEGHVSLVDILNYLENNDTAEAVREQTEQQQQYHDEEQQGLQDATDNADSAGDTSGSQAESQGSTLLKAFIDFVGALTGSTASDCVINADIGDFKMGNIDLCQLSPPPAFQVITSIMVIGFTVPLSIALGKKMIALFRSFQT